MNAPAFVDTSALYACFSKHDRSHRAAARTLAELREERAALVTSGLVLLEAYVLVHSRTGRAGLLRFRDVIARSRWLTTLAVTMAQETEAWRMLESHADKEWSFVDASSFVLMRSAGITRAFAFDEHFAQAGFEVLPGPEARASRRR